MDFFSGTFYLKSGMDIFPGLMENLKTKNLGSLNSVNNYQKSNNIRANRQY